MSSWVLLEPGCPASGVSWCPRIIFSWSAASGGIHSLFLYIQKPSLVSSQYQLTSSGGEFLVASFICFSNQESGPIAIIFLTLKCSGLIRVTFLLLSCP